MPPKKALPRKAEQVRSITQHVDKKPFLSGFSISLPSWSKPSMATVDSSSVPQEVLVTNKRVLNAIKKKNTWDPRKSKKTAFKDAEDELEKLKTVKNFMLNSTLRSQVTQALSNIEKEKTKYETNRMSREHLHIYTRIKQIVGYKPTGTKKLESNDFTEKTGVIYKVPDAYQRELERKINELMALYKSQKATIGNNESIKNMIFNTISIERIKLFEHNISDSGEELLDEDSITNIISSTSNIRNVNVNVIKQKFISEKNINEILKNILSLSYLIFNIQFNLSKPTKIDGETTSFYENYLKQRLNIAISKAYFYKFILDKKVEQFQKIIDNIKIKISSNAHSINTNTSDKKTFYTYSIMLYKLLYQNNEYLHDDLITILTSKNYKALSRLIGDANSGANRAISKIKKEEYNKLMENIKKYTTKNNNKSIIDVSNLENLNIYDFSDDIRLASVSEDNNSVNIDTSGLNLDLITTPLSNDDVQILLHLYSQFKNSIKELNITCTFSEKPDRKVYGTYSSSAYTGLARTGRALTRGLVNYNPLTLGAKGTYAVARLGYESMYNTEFDKYKASNIKYNISDAQQKAHPTLVAKKSNMNKFSDTIAKMNNAAKINGVTGANYDSFNTFKTQANALKAEYNAALRKLNTSGNNAIVERINTLNTTYNALLDSGKTLIAVLKTNVTAKSAKAKLAKNQNNNANSDLSAFITAADAFVDVLTEPSSINETVTKIYGNQAKAYKAVLSTNLNAKVASRKAKLIQKIEAAKAELKTIVANVNTSLTLLGSYVTKLTNPQYSTLQGIIQKIITDATAAKALVDAVVNEQNNTGNARTHTNARKNTLAKLKGEHKTAYEALRNFNKNNKNNTKTGVNQIAKALIKHFMNVKISGGELKTIDELLNHIESKRNEAPYITNDTHAKKLVDILGANSKNFNTYTLSELLTKQNVTLKNHDATTNIAQNNYYNLSILLYCYKNQQINMDKLTEIEAFSDALNTFVTTPTDTNLQTAIVAATPLDETNEA
jgi:hypothetical protein